MHRTPRLIAALFALALLAAACGDDDDSDDASTAATSSDDTSTTEAPVPGETTAPDDPTTTTEPVPDAEAEDPPEDAGEDDGLGDPLVFVSELTGDTEVPGPGDPSATGRFEIESSTNGELCFDIEASGLDSEVADSHIHEGPAGVSGGVVIPIGTPTSSDGDTDTWTDVCVDVDAELVDRIIADPSAFYSNIHTANFGAGAIRGQLEAATIFDLTLS